jgi:glycosyltransferase involved in cell wall biosynthesis
MLVSVIVPVYKVEKYIHRCVDSILAQTFRDFELILVDDGSPDNCGAICEEYAAKDSRIHVIHRENGGLSAARNSGIEWALANSDSQWLTFIDSDDWVHPQFLEVLVHGVQTSGAQAGMVGRSYVSEFDPGYTTYTSLPQAEIYDGEALFLSREWDFNYAWGKLYRKEDFRTLRYPEGKNFEDVFTTYQVFFQVEKIALMDEPLYFYFHNTEGISHSRWNAKEMVIFEGMRQQMAFYRDNGYLRALKKEERLYVHHHAYQLIRIRENKADWKKNKPIWRKIRREMLELMKHSNGKYTYKTMPYCFEAAHPHLARVKALAGRAAGAWKRYGFRGIWKKIGEKLGG